MDSRYGYMCKTDYDWELGEALGGNTIFPSVDDLKRNYSCWKTCGIVKVKVEVVEITEVAKPFNSGDNSNE